MGAGPVGLDHPADSAMLAEVCAKETALVCVAA